MLWSAGEMWPSELWRYVPGAAQPELLFTSPRADGNITAVVGAESGWAFVELSETAFGKGGWRVWFLSSPGGEPIELDRGKAAGAGSAPTIAMDDDHIVWAAFDEPADGPWSVLRFAKVAQLDRSTTLLKLRIRDGLIWHPALHGDELWYGVIKGDFDLTGVGDEFHVETIDLANLEAAPVKFAGRADDFGPAVNDDFIVWKTNARGDSALNWGTLYVMDRGTDAVATIPVTRADRPSIGDRFIAFEEISHSRLAVFDPVTGTLVDLIPAGSADGLNYGGQSIDGRLFAFYSQVGGESPRIGWAMLPE